MLSHALCDDLPFVWNYLHSACLFWQQDKMREDFFSLEFMFTLLVDSTM